MNNLVEWLNGVSNEMDDTPPKSTAEIKPVAQSTQRGRDTVWCWGRECSYKKHNRNYTLLEVRSECSEGEVLLQAHLDPPVTGTSKHGGDKRLLHGSLPVKDTYILKREIADGLLSFSIDSTLGFELPGICKLADIEAALKSRCMWLENCQFFLVRQPESSRISRSNTINSTKTFSSQTFSQGRPNRN